MIINDQPTSPHLLTQQSNIMSDWRQQSPSDSSSRRKPTTMPVVPRSPEKPANIDKPKGKGGDWRQKSSERGWIGAGEKSRPEIGSLRKSVLLTALGLVTLSCVGIFVAVVLFRPRLIPVIVANANHANINSLGEAPYASSYVNLLRSLKLKNTFVAIPAPEEPTDRFLKAMDRQEKWIEGFVSKFGNGTQNLSISNGKLEGGGPNKNIVTFLIQGTLIRSVAYSDPTNGTNKFHWAIAHSDENAFGNDNKEAGVSLKDLFRNLSQSLAPGNIGLLALDVQMPTIASNIADLELPINAIQSEFDSLGTQVDNLVVLLPCEQGQENWYSPELSTSTFSHAFLNGLETGFGDKHLTLASFESKFKYTVTKWVEQNRDTLQVPKFLMTPATRNSLGKYSLYRSLLTVLPDEIHVNQVRIDTLTSRYRELEQLWDEFNAISQIAHWDPVTFNKIQYQLIALEDIAEMDGQSWLRRRDVLVRSIQTARERWKNPAANVSLVESLFNQRLKRSVSFTEVATASHAEILTISDVRSFFESPSSLDSTPSGSVDQKTRRNDKALLLWESVVRAAESNDASIWRKVLAPVRLKEALEWLGPSPSNIPEWLEIQQLRILAEELSWHEKNAPDNLEESIAKLISCINLHQLICTTSLSGLNRLPYERLAWHQGEVLANEKQLLKAFDGLIANRIVESLNHSRQLYDDLLKLKTRAIDLEEAMYYRDHIPQVVPVWLSVLMRSYRYDVTDEKLLIAEDLGTLLHRAVITEQQLSNPSPQRPNLDTELKKDFESLENRLYREVRVLVADAGLQASSDPETIRDRRIALRFPYLSAALRERYHEDFIRYLADRKKSNSVNSQIVPKDVLADIAVKSNLPSEISDRFLQRLRELNCSRVLLYSQYCQADPRLDLLQFFNTKSDSSSAKGKIFAESATVRHLAPAISLLDNVGEGAPWNACLRRQVLNETEHRGLQRNRLILARWGDGPIPSDHEQFYFQRLVHEYSNVNAALLSAIAQEAPKSLDESKYSKEANESVKALKELRAGNQSPKDLQASVELSSSERLWQGALFSIRQLSGSLSADANQLNNAVVGGSIQDFPLSVPFDWEEQPLVVRLCLRGNVTTKTVTADQNREGVVTYFSRTPSKPTIKVIPDGKIGSIAIALDCSGSMSYGGQVTAFESARRTVQKLLLHLSDLDRELQIRNDVVILFFGLSNFPFESDLLLPEHALQIQGRRVENVFATQFARTGSDSYDELEALLMDSRLRAQGTTPLYNALSLASELLVNRGGEGSEFNRIVVISDGANEVDATKLKGFNTNASELRRRLSLSKCQVQVFQFNNLDFYRNAIDKRDPEGKQRIWPDGRILDDKLREIGEANGELLALLQSLTPGQEGKDVFFEDFSKLQTKLSESFKLPRLTAVYEDGDRQRIDLTFSKTEQLPGPGQVNVVVGDAANDLGEVKRSLQLISDEVIVLKFSSLRNQLFFNPSPIPTAKTLPLVNNVGGSADYLVDWNRTASQKLDFRISIRKSRLAEEMEYVPRPAFLVGVITDTSGEVDADKHLLIDYYFENSYPPVVSIQDVQLRLKPQSLMKLDLWSSTEFPAPLMESIKLNDGERKVASKVDAQLERNGKTVIARIRSTPSNRVFVIAPDAIKAQRKSYYLKGEGTGASYEEVHELQFADENPVVYLMDEKALTNSPQELKIEHRRTEHAL